MICAECGTENAVGTTDCRGCGADLPPAGTAVLIRRGEGTTFVLPGEAVVGRMERCQVSVPDKSVSREHARVIRSGDRYIVRDLGSTNGTLVNGRRIEGDVPLRPGDMITVGSVEFLFAQEDPAEPNQEGTLTHQEESAPAASFPPDDDLTFLDAAQPPAEPRAPGDAMAEIAQTAGRLVDLVRALVQDHENNGEEAAQATIDDVRSALATIQTDVSPDAVQTAQQLLDQLQHDPRDIETLLAVGRNARELVTLVGAYDEMRRAVQAIATAVAPE